MSSDPDHPTTPGLIAPSSGHSPFARVALPTTFPATSLFAQGPSASPYVTDQPRSALNLSFGGADYLPPSARNRATAGGAGGGASEGPVAAGAKPAQGEPRGQTLEEMYSAPENTLEIEVRDPRTQGASALPPPRYAL